MGEGFFILLAIAGILYLLVGPALGIAAFMRGSDGTASQVAGLLRRIDDLSAELAKLKRLLEVLTAGNAPAETPALRPADESAAPTAASAVERPSLSSPPEEPRARETPADEPASATFESEEPSSAPDTPGIAGPAPALPLRRGSIEQWLASRGLIWLGGAVLALAGLFLAKYSYERGWLVLGPAGRVTAGFLFGLALTLGGEWLRRRPLQRAIAAIGPNYLPPALTAAGLSSAFASLYAAYGLYALLSPLLAFVLMALVAFAAFGLAILQGPMIAVLALLGGFATPLLVASPAPSAWGLFAYLLALTAASLGVVRYMACWWLAWGALAGSVLWGLLWFAALWAPGDAPALGSFLVLLAGLFLALRYRAETAPRDKLSTPDHIAWTAAALVALLAFGLVRMDGYGPTSLAAVFVLVSLYLAIAWQDAVFEGLVPLGAALALVVVALWHLPAIADWPAFTHSYRGEDYGTALGPVVPPQLGAFVTVSLTFGALYATAGFAALARARRPALWAGASAGLPVLLLAVAYWRVTGLGIDLTWSVAALVIAGLGLAATLRLHRHPPRASHDRGGKLDGYAANDLLLGIYALGSIAALGLALAMALEQAWLTVALSLQLPAIAWISSRLNLRALRPVALLMAAVVLVRLVVNYNILTYPLGTLPAVNWILYGYGLPALAFWWSARQFRKIADDRLVLALEGGALVLVWLLVTYEIRSLVAGDLGSRSYDLAEQSLQTVAWLTMAYAWLRAYRRSGRRTLLWGWRLLAGLAAVQSPLFQLLLSNPLWSGEPVGDWPLVNLLALAYLVPGGFALAFARELRSTGHRKAAMGAAIYALLLVFTFLSLEVRRAFHGPLLDSGPTGDGELLTYTLVWLSYAWVLLTLGIKSGYASLRYASLAILAVATAKVLFFDWGTLEGLARFFSFAALGFSLLGIPFLYQKLVFPPPEPAPAPDPGSSAAPGASA